MWRLTGALGSGVGSRPPPGRFPATALAGASSDKALASSGIDPAGGATAEIRSGTPPDV